MAVPRIKRQLPDAVYFSTLTVIEWIDIFTKPVYTDILINSLKYCQQNKGLNLYGYVFMSNHIHLIFSTDNGHSADNFLRDFKKWTTRLINKELDNEPRRYIRNLLKTSVFKKRKNNIQIWQPNNFSEIVQSRYFFKQKLEYIHMNPIKRGYVSKPEDWVYSSARNWVCGDHSVIEVMTTELS